MALSSGVQTSKACVFLASSIAFSFFLEFVSTVGYSLDGCQLRMNVNSMEHNILPVPMFD